MAELQVLGVGLGRTGTNSLKVALERLTGAPCYHMLEVFQRPEHVPMWHAAALGEPVDFRALFAGYAAAVDWPPVAFWPEISRIFPDAILVLSVRDSASWWKSANQTIFDGLARRAGARSDAWYSMVHDLLSRRFTEGYLDETEARAAFERHYETVRQTAPPERLVEWRPEAGWGPLCSALGVPVPDEPFPHINTTEQFRARVGLDR